MDTIAHGEDFGRRLHLKKAYGIDVDVSVLERLVAGEVCWLVRASCARCDEWLTCVADACLS